MNAMPPFEFFYSESIGDDICMSHHNYKTWNRKDGGGVVMNPKSIKNENGEGGGFME